MKKLIVSMFSMTISVSSFGYTEQIMDVNGDKLLAVKSHTSHHTNPDAHSITTLRIDGLEGNCSLGVFFDSNINKGSLSIALSAISMKRSVQIVYDADTQAPWGNSNYCALTSIQVSQM